VDEVFGRRNAMGIAAGDRQLADQLASVNIIGDQRRYLVVALIDPM
jgi:hypothetical protein